MKVKVITTASAANAEKMINDFLQEGYNFEIINIKWSVSDNKYTALIIYK